MSRPRTYFTNMFAPKSEFCEQVFSIFVSDDFTRLGFYPFRDGRAINFLCKMVTASGAYFARKGNTSVFLWYLDFGRREQLITAGSDLSRTPSYCGMQPNTNLLPQHIWCHLRPCPVWRGRWLPVASPLGLTTTRRGTLIRLCCVYRLRALLFSAGISITVC